MVSRSFDLIEAMWQDLGLEPSCVQSLQQEFVNPLMFVYAFDTERELSDLLMHHQQSSIHQDALAHQVKCVILWRDRQCHRLKFLEADMFDRVKRPRLDTFSTGVSSQEAFCNYTALSSPLQYKLSRTSYRQQLKSPGATKAELEKSLRDQWSAVLVNLVLEAKLPIVEMAEKTMDPVKTIFRAIGNRRAKTIRNRARTWSNFRSWLMLVKGRVFPSDVSDLLDYLLYHMQEGGNKSFVDSIAAALSVVEDVGMVASSDRFSQNGVWLKTCKSYVAEFEEVSKRPRVAPPLTVSMLVSMEMEVCDLGRPIYARALYWVILVAVWACMRLSDFDGVDIGRMKLLGTGLSGTLVRTKTTGPGKRVLEVQFFVKRDISLSGCDWLATGWELWADYNQKMPRDFFLMKSNQDWSEPVRRYLKPEGMAIYFRALIQLLRVPRRNRFVAGFKLEEDSQLICPDGALYFTGHSMRHTIPTFSAMMGCDKDDRDYLGRWHIPMHSQQYVNNSRQAIHRIQETVAAGLCTGSPSYDPRENLADMETFITQRGGDGQMAVSCNSIMRHRVQMMPRQDIWELGLKWPTFDIEEDGVLVDGPNQEVEIGEDHEQEELAPYFVVISRKTGFRRLHKRNTCGVDWQNCKKVEFIHNITKDCADSICATCKRLAGMSQADDHESSSSGSSSSTPSDHEENVSS